jgi:hypothetical protein
MLGTRTFYYLLNESVRRSTPLATPINLLALVCCNIIMLLYKLLKNRATLLMLIGVLGIWFEKVVSRCRRGQISFTRSADDFVCLFQCKDEPKVSAEIC